MVWRMQVEAALVDEPELLSFRGTFKLASEPRGVARSAALAAAEMVLVNKHPPPPPCTYCCMPDLLSGTCMTFCLSQMLLQA